MSDEAGLAKKVRRGLLWSAVNNSLVRFASLGVGILLAHLLTPADFGVFAVALTVQVIMITLAELGISADLIRRGDVDRRGPTVATISVAAGLVTTGLMIIFSRPFATALGSSAATPVLQVMSLTLLLAGFSTVPYARMQREFMQSRQLLIDATSLLVSTAMTVGLVLLFDFGPMALAVGRIAGQLMVTGLQFAITRTRPRFGWDSSVAREALRFGLPIAGANLLSWVILSVDNMIIGHSLGAVSLGVYVLAFNLSSWPMNAVGLTIRSVALPALGRLDHDEVAMRTALRSAAALTCAMAVPLGVLLVIFAHPLIALLYGAKWAAAAPVLQALGAFGTVRVLIDLYTSFLYARGRSRAVVAAQVVWLIALLPAMIVGIHLGGLVGAGWAHVAVGVVVLLPAYLLLIRRAGSRLRPQLAQLLVAVGASIPAGAAALILSYLISGPPLLLLAIGGIGFLAIYALTVMRWVRRAVRRLRTISPSEPSTSGLEQMVVAS